MGRFRRLRGLTALVLLTGLLMAWDGNAKAVINRLSQALKGGPPRLYTFPTDVSRKLAPGLVNLLSDASFENGKAKMCTFECNAASGWSLEHFSTGMPIAYRTRTGVVAGSYAEELVYHGQKGDNGVHKDIELYHGAVGPLTRPGHKLTFTLWVSGTCVKCTPFIGIEAFDIKNHYLGESDQFLLPAGKAESGSSVVPAAVRNHRGGRVHSGAGALFVLAGQADRRRRHAGRLAENICGTGTHLQVTANSRHAGSSHVRSVVARPALPGHLLSV